MKKILLFTFLFPFITANAQCYESLSFTGSHTLAMATDGSLWGWGRADGGMLSTANDTEPNPFQLTTIANVDKYYAGVLNTFVIKTDGTLWGVGSNMYGSLGANSTTISYQSFQQITTANNWQKVSVGSYGTLALKTDGTIWAWGLDTENQTGNPPATESQIVPIQVGTANDWIDIDTGNSLTPFALKADGSLWGWGFNQGSLLVASSSVVLVNTPTLINAGPWVKMHVGSGFILAQKADGTLWAWGNGAGRGVGEVYGGNVPLQIGTDTWKDFSAKFTTSFGIKSNGTLWAWGYNDYGVLGDGTTVDRYVPTQIGTDTNWKTVHAGRSLTSMATKTDGTIWYWSVNYYGEFGNGLDYETTVYPSPQLSPNACVQSLDLPSFENTALVLLYPNPADDQVFVKLQESRENDTLELFDLMGRAIYTAALPQSDSPFQINTQNYTAGVYIVVIKQNDKIVSKQKLIIE